MLKNFLSLIVICFLLAFASGCESNPTSGSITPIVNDDGPIIACASQTSLVDELNGVSFLPLGGAPLLKMAQKFTLSESQEIFDITIRAQGSAPGEEIIVDIIEGGADPTAGVVVATSTLTTISASYETYTTDFSSRPVLSASTDYWIYLTANNETAAGINVERSDSGDAYDALGDLWWNTSIVPWSTFGTGFDLNFKMNVCI